MLRALHTHAANVTFIPPAPQQVNSLMQGLLDYANDTYPTNSKEALVKSLLVSFGFVYNHPFLDGNGRISRFLIHHGLCRAHLLDKDLINLIRMAISNDGVLSKNRRKQYTLTVPNEVMDAIEQIVRGYF